MDTARSDPSHVQPIDVSAGLYRYEFMAWLPEEVLGRKLLGFLTEQRGRILSTADDQIRIRLGKRNWLPLLRTEGDSPVEMTIFFRRPDGPGTSSTHVEVELRPGSHGDAADRTTDRCNRLVRALRYSLMAQDFPRPLANYAQGTA